MIAWQNFADWKPGADWWVSMFQPQNWNPNIFGSVPLTCSNHRAISHLLVGNHGEHLGPNSFLIKTQHTTLAIKLEGMLGACLVISLSVSLGLHLARSLLEKQNERQALVRVLRVSPHWTLRAKVYMCERVNVEWWRAFGRDEEHISQIKEWWHGWLFNTFFPFSQLFLFFCLCLSNNLSSQFSGQLIKSTNLIRACLKRPSGASCGDRARKKLGGFVLWFGKSPASRGKQGSIFLSLLHFLPLVFAVRQLLRHDEAPRRASLRTRFYLWQLSEVWALSRSPKGTS